jgi:two-component sensor histidine kinase
MMAEILGRATKMPVFDARDGELVQPQPIHVLPSSATLTIREGRLRLRRIRAEDRERTPIDVFFTSLAADQAEHAIGVLLSGGGSDGRLHSLGHTHDVLSAAGWTEAGLRELILAELSPHDAGDGDVVRISGPPVLLKPQAALFLTLALHELSTNAAKYGALSVAGGRVGVSWSITGDQPPRLEISWREEGGPKIDGLGARGFGMELIERGIRFELQGEAKIEMVNGGLHCRIVVPANPQNLTLRSAGNTEDRAT